MISYAVIFGLVSLAVAMGLNLLRLLKGPSIGDRILAMDTMVINTIAIILLIGITNKSDSFFEAALLLAMVGFVGTVAYCKFLLRGDIIE